MLPNTQSYTSITFDSREVREGSLFFALKGSHVNGAEFLPEVFKHGALAAVVEDDSERTEGAVYYTPRAREIMADISKQFYGDPTGQLLTLGVTGTNGKTTVAWLVAQALSRLKGRAAYLGTLGVVLFHEGEEERRIETKNTTPESLTTQRYLAEMLKCGAQAFALEVSSHAIELGRVRGLEFDAIAFTNLTQDHLDLHGDMDSYGQVKARLFTEILSNSKKGKVAAVLNAEDRWGRRIADSLERERLVEVVRYSRNTQEGLFVTNVRTNSDGSGMSLLGKFNDEELSFSTTLFGSFHQSNLLAAWGLLRSAGFSSAEVSDSLSQSKSAPGRLERIGERLPLVFVDYAHTPDGLESVLKTTREFCSGRLIVVFGCGGDRDRTKRPIMGRIAATLADLTLVTSDNPRTEDLKAILCDIEKGVREVPDAVFELICDRKEAIRRALLVAKNDDLVLIAGKGHEEYQEIQGVRHPFSDRLVVEELFN